MARSFESPLPAKPEYRVQHTSAESINDSAYARRLAAFCIFHIKSMRYQKAYHTDCALFDNRGRNREFHKQGFVRRSY